MKSKRPTSSAVKRRNTRGAKPTPTPRFSPGEYVRVVPLHSPTPSKTIDELRKTKRAVDDDELFKGSAAPAQAGPHLTFNGGALLKNVQVYTIFWGRTWSAAPGSAVAASINAFFKAILVSPLIDQLAEYNVPGQAIGHGSFIGTKVITTNAPASSVTDTMIRAQLTAWVNARVVPPRTANTLYFLYLDPGVASVMGGSRSCTSYCGYHNNVGTTYYAVMPYPSCAGCLGGLSAVDALTGTSSHELCEAITDPVPGRGWYDNQNGEIGDICAWSFKTVAGYTVQLEWSNARNQCV